VFETSESVSSILASVLLAAIELPLFIGRASRIDCGDIGVVGVGEGTSDIREMRLDSPECITISGDA
jgi:hypothetical protein